MLKTQYKAQIIEQYQYEVNIHLKLVIPLYMIIQKTLKVVTGTL